VSTGKQEPNPRYSTKDNAPPSFGIRKTEPFPAGAGVT